MQCPISNELLLQIRHSLDAVHQAQTAPFADAYGEYMRALKQTRELKVRTSQLEKEAAELRDENRSLHHRLEKLDENTLRCNAAQVQEYKDASVKLEREVSALYKDKSRLLEELVAANTDVRASKRQAEAMSAELATVTVENARLKEESQKTAAALTAEKSACAAATGELHSSMVTREEAVKEAERLREENIALARRLVDLKSNELHRMEEINKLHEEAFEQSVMMRTQAAADKEAVDLIRSRMVEGGELGGPSHAQLSLKDVMHIPLSIAPENRERRLPKAPFRSVSAHKGGCCSLAMQSRGYSLASCGMDRVVQLWDLGAGFTTSMGSRQLQGMMGGVNDVAFNCEGSQLLGAGMDKSLHLWDVSTGQCRHTLTGHSASVTGVAASPLNDRLAVSCSEDRCIKMWDLGKGFSLRSVPCTKMPNTVMMSSDGNSIISGHVEGSICLWDVRQCRAGATSSLMESKNHTQAIASLSPSSSDSIIVVASKDNSVSLWDFRTMATMQTFKMPQQLSIGTIGSVGRGRCHVEMSRDGRFLAVGALDGSVVVWDLETTGSAPSSGVTVLSGFHKETVIATAWNLDSTQLVTADRAGTIAFWSLVE